MKLILSVLMILFIISFILLILVVISKKNNDINITKNNSDIEDKNIHEK